MVWLIKHSSKFQKLLLDSACWISDSFWSSKLRDGSEPSLPAVATGSHIDAIPYSGKYDGVVGVLGAIEAINVLKRYKESEKMFESWQSLSYCVFLTIFTGFLRSGFKPKRSLEIIMFTSEEPTRFGISCLGR